ATRERQVSSFTACQSHLYSRDGFRLESISGSKRRTPRRWKRRSWSVRASHWTSISLLIIARRHIQYVQIQSGMATRFSRIIRSRLSRLISDRPVAGHVLLHFQVAILRYRDPDVLLPHFNTSKTSLVQWVE